MTAITLALRYPNPSMFNPSMFNTYADIFNQRGQHYHRAMLDYPLARQAEFQTAIDCLELQAGHVLCDVPSGGCYLAQFIPVPIKLISVETSSEFIRQANPQENNVTITTSTVTEIPLLDQSVDRIISLAGLHHVANQSGFYREAYRLLKSQGILALVDVRQGSGVDGFLNGFVHKHNSMGHQGNFLGLHTIDELLSAGFEVRQASPKSYDWYFDSPESMVRCCKLLFGIDRADDAKILVGIEQHLGYREEAGQCLMHWELYFFQAIKT
jgi:SAM-dependent methyltransferase